MIKSTIAPIKVCRQKPGFVVGFFISRLPRGIVITSF